jgi:2-polyprenyl-3-methyl-5-hydroxy-6-metoxy-1,4-benzoquinol methylase
VKHKQNKRLAKSAKEELIKVVSTLRSSPSPVFMLDALSKQSCICCGNRDLGVSRYPAFNSRFFTGLLLMHCLKCGLVWVPVPSLDLNHFYTHHYAREFRKERIFDGAFYSPNNPIWARKHHKVRDRGLRQAQMLAEFGTVERLLDIGCGEGFFLHQAKAKEKYAVELDENVHNILTQELKVTLVSGLDRPEFYDAIVRSHVLEHFTYDTIRDKLAQIFASLRPGGRYLLEVPAGTDQLALFISGGRPATQRLEPHTLFFSTYSLVRLLTETGFDIEFAAMCHFSRNTIEIAEDLQSRLGNARLRDGGALEIIARKPADVLQKMRPTTCVR